MKQQLKLRFARVARFFAAARMRKARSGLMDENGRVAVGMGSVAFEAGQVQAGHAFGFERAGEIIRQIPPPSDGAIFQGDLIGVADADAGSVVRFNRIEHLGRAVVKNAAFVFRPAIQFHGHVFQTHILNAAVCRPVDAHAVFGLAGNVLDLNVTQRSQFGRRQSRDGRE